MEGGLEVVWKLVGRWFGSWLGGGLEAVWEVVWRLGEASGAVPGEVPGDAYREPLGLSSRTAWASRNAVFLQCFVASAESCRNAKRMRAETSPAQKKSTKTQREGNCLRTRITCPRHGGG